MTRPDLPPEADAEALLRYLASIKSTNDKRRLAEAAVLLSHSDPDVRAEAISTVLTHGRMTEHREVARKALRGDAAEDVRGAAAYALAALSTEDTRKDDVELLLGALSDLDESDEVRRGAYEALQIVHQRSDFPDASTTFLPEADIDWSWVRAVGALHGIHVRNEW